MRNRIIRQAALAASFLAAGLTPAAGQVQIGGVQPISGIRLERQVLGKDVTVWEQPESKDGPITIPATVCAPGTYTLSFTADAQPLSATVLLEQGELRITLGAAGSSRVRFSGKDGGQNTAYNAFREKEQELGNDYSRYQQLAAAYPQPGAFRQRLDNWWAQRTAEWEAYKDDLAKAWNGHALADIARSTWGTYYNAYPAAFRQQLPSQLPSLARLTYNANLLEGKDLEYLRLLFVLPAKDKEALTDTLLTYLPVLLDRALANDSLTQYWGYNLRKELNRADLDEVQELIDTRYLAKACTAENDKDLQQRLAAYKNTRKGQLAPDIQAPDFDLYKNVQADTTLIIFWASWCPHCSEELPLLYQALRTRAGLQVVAVALDEYEPAWLRAKQPYTGWHHIRASGKWDDANVLPYGVYATPTMFVLDKEKRVIRKYSSVADFLKR